MQAANNKTTISIPLLIPLNNSCITNKHNQDLSLITIQTNAPRNNYKIRATASELDRLPWANCACFIKNNTTLSPGHYDNFPPHKAKNASFRTHAAINLLIYANAFASFVFRPIASNRSGAALSPKYENKTVRWTQKVVFFKVIQALHNK